MAEVIDWPTPLEVIGGASWSQDFEFGHYEPAEEEGGEPTWTLDDLSTWTDWACHWRPHVLSDTKIELTIDSSSADEGKILVTATPAQTRAMDGSGYFEVRGANGGDAEPLVRGRTTWRLGVTR